MQYSRVAADHVSPSRDQRAALSQGMSKQQARALFASHALTTWNARTYEFAAILFTAEAFPNTLLPSSIRFRGLVTTAAALLLSSAIGTSIDKSSERLKPLLLSITLNRSSVLIASFIWGLLLGQWTLFGAGFSAARIALFCGAILVGIIEKLSGIGNMLASERDWVPILANPEGVYTLTKLNSVMRRIDLICKLVSPLVISFLISSTSPFAGVVVVGIMSGCSWAVEMFTARYVWSQNDQLRMPKTIDQSAEARQAVREGSAFAAGVAAVASAWQSMKQYFKTDVWVPSLSLAMLHFSALSYSATMITFLLNTGLPLLAITIARTFGSAVEISSTFLTPFGIKHLANTRSSRMQLQEEHDMDESREDDDPHFEHKHDVGLARSGLWGVTLQLFCLIPVVLAIVQMQAQDVEATPEVFTMIGLNMKPSWVAACATLFAFLSLSRLGLWAFDLTTQELTQTRVERSQRSAFAGTEMAFVSFFELNQWAIAAILSRPDQFKWIATASLAAVALSTIMYAVWVRQQRGHLLHWDKIGGGCTSCGKSAYRRIQD